MSYFKKIVLICLFLCVAKEAIAVDPLLIQFVKERRLQDVGQLIGRPGVDVNERGDEARTALYWAVSNNDIWMVYELLKDRRTRVDLGDVYGWTPIHVAACQKRPDIMALLLWRVPDIFSQNVALKSNNHSIMRSLLNWFGYVEEHLLDQKSPLDVYDLKGQTALHLAAENGNIPIVEILLSTSANINFRDNLRQTPLHKAVRNVRLDVIKKLIAAKADVNIPDIAGQTVLHQAASTGKWDIVRLLTQAGATVNWQDKVGRSAIHEAAVAGSPEVIEELIQSGNDINLKDRAGYTALHLAAEKGHSLVVSKLIQAYANVNLQNRAGKTALHFAAEKGHSGIIAQLIEARAETDLKDSDGRTAQKIALINQFTEISEMLNNVEAVRRGWIYIE